MHFQLTEDQQMIREAARAFARDRVKPRAAAIDEALNPPPGLLREMGQSGLLGMCLPEAAGGIGADTVSFAVAVEEVAQASASMSAFMVINNLLVGETLRRYAPEALARPWLERVAAGDCLGAFAAHHPDTTAAPGPGLYRLTGRKDGVTAGGVAAFILTPAGVPSPDGGAMQPSLFFIPGDAGGLTRTPGPQAMGLRGTAVAALDFTDCAVPDTHLLGEAGQGPAIVEAARDAAGIGVAAQALGLAEAACRDAADYAGARRQFGQPIGRFQAIAYRLADMQTEIEATRYMVYHTAWLRDQGRDIRVPAARASLRATAMANRVVDAALQIHGGYGYMREYPVERYFRDIRTLEACYGAPDAQRKIIAAPLLEEWDG